MNYSEIIQKIGSVRDFKEAQLEANALELIQKDAKKEAPEKLQIICYTDGDSIYKKLSGKAGYFGNLIKAPVYMLFLSSDYDILAAAAETARFSAFDKGISSCWLTMQDPKNVKKELGITSDYDLLALIAFGKADTGYFKQDMSARSGRNAATEIAFIDKWGNEPTWEDLEQRGLGDVFYYTRFAPSWGNVQPCKFIVDKSNIIMTVESSNKEDAELNIGLSMFYFLKACSIAGYNLKEVSSDIDGNKYAIPSGIKIKKVFTF